MMTVPFAADKDSDIHRALNLTTRAQTQEHLANLNAELSEQVKPGQKWLFSSEFFASRLRSEAEIRACVDFLRQHFDDIKVVVYFRRPEFMVASTYSQSVKEGLSHRLDMAYVERRSHDFSHLPLLAKWQAVVGSDNVKTMPYLERYRSDSEAMLNSFLTTVGVPLRDDWTQPDRTSSNQSLRSEGLAVLRTINFVFPGPTYYTRSLVHQRAALARRVQSTTGGDRIGLTAEMTSALHTKFAAANKQLAAQVSGPDWEVWLNQPPAPPVAPTAANITNPRLAEVLLGLVDEDEKITAAFIAQIVGRLARPVGIVDWNDPTGQPDLEGWRRQAQRARTRVRRGIRRMKPQR